MANWWEDPGFVQGNWSNIQSGAQSHYDPSQGRMDFLNPSGSEYFMPFTPSGQTGQGLTPGLGAAAPGGGNMADPYYGYGYLFGAPSGPLTPPGTPNALTALGQPGAGQSALAAMAPTTNPAVRAATPWNPGTGPAGAPPGPATSQGNVTYSPVGDQEKILDQLFKGSVTGQGGGPIAKMLYNLGLGQLPPALAQQIVGTTNEQFGKMGARFGTDLATADARGLAQASEAQALSAIRQILGLGGTTAGFQFQRGESALERAMREFIAQQQMDPLNSVLQSLLGG